MDNRDRTVKERTCLINILRSAWQLFLILILIILLLSLSGFLIIQLKTQKSLRDELHQMAKEILAARYTPTQLQKEYSQLKQLLNATYQNMSILENEIDQQKLFLNETLYNATLLSAENTNLTKLLKRILKEKFEIQMENKELKMLLNSTLEKYDLIFEENRKLDGVLNSSVQLRATSEENNKLKVLLNSSKKTSAQLEEINKKQHSILSSSKLSFLWSLCNKDTLECTRCPPGWVEHASRCFYLSRVPEKWEDARRDCLNKAGDLAVVTDAGDQAFLTNMTFQFVKDNPHENFHSAWIGLQDMVKENTFIWVNGDRVKWDVSYWKEKQPNNVVPSWDSDMIGQDCIAILPPKKIESEDWMNSWDDIVCGEKRNFLCEATALILS